MRVFVNGGLGIFNCNFLLEIRLQKVSYLGNVISDLTSEEYKVFLYCIKYIIYVYATRVLISKGKNCCNVTRYITYQ